VSSTTSSHKRGQTRFGSILTHRDACSEKRDSFSSLTPANWVPFTTESRTARCQDLTNIYTIHWTYSERTSTFVMPSKLTKKSAWNNMHAAASAAWPDCILMLNLGDLQRSTASAPASKAQRAKDLPRRSRQNVKIADLAFSRNPGQSSKKLTTPGTATTGIGSSNYSCLPRPPTLLADPPRLQITPASHTRGWATVPPLIPLCHKIRATVSQAGIVAFPVFLPSTFSAVGASNASIIR